MRIRTLVLFTSVFFALLWGVPGAFAAGPQTQPAVLQSVTFESASASDTLQITTAFDPFNTYVNPPATWGTVGTSYLSGGHGFWCAGSVPSAWNRYPVGTRGHAYLWVPDATQDYSSQIQFSYIEPSLGAVDRNAGIQPFVVNWSATTPTGGSGAYADTDLPLSTTWRTLTRVRGAAGNNPPRAAGWLRFQFVSSPYQSLGAQGVTIDDVKVTGFLYGPPVDVAALRHRGALTQATITWDAPRAVGGSGPDQRDIWYRVWRHDIAANTWTELTTSAIAAKTLEDTGVDISRSYKYAIQGYAAADDSAKWGVSAMSPIVGPALPHFGAVSASAGSVPYSGEVTITAPLSDETGDVFSGEASHIALQRSFNGGASWTTISAAVSEVASGTYAARTAVQTNTRYRLHYAGGAVADSAAVLVKSGTFLSTPSTPSRVRRNRAFTVKGKASAVPGVKRSITLRAYRKESKTVGGKRTTVWTLRSTVVAKLPAGLGVKSYSASMKLKLAGSYRIRARVSDSYSGAITSSYRYFSAR